MKIGIGLSQLDNSLYTNRKKYSKKLIYSKSDFRYLYFSGKNFEIKKKIILELQKIPKIKENLFLASYYFLRQNKLIDIILFGASSQNHIKNICLPYKNFFLKKELKIINRKIKKLNSIHQTITQY